MKYLKNVCHSIAVLPSGTLDKQLNNFCVHLDSMQWSTIVPIDSFNTSKYSDSIEKRPHISVKSAFFYFVFVYIHLAISIINIVKLCPI